MAALIDLWITSEKIKILHETIQKKGAKGVSITLAVTEATNNYGQNVTGYVSQSKEERDAKKARFYVGNGKVFWTDGAIVIAERKDDQAATDPQPSEKGDDDPPF